MTALLYGDPDPSLRWRAALELDAAAEDDDDVCAWRREIDASATLAALVHRLDAARDQPRTAGYLLARLAHLGYRGPALRTGAEALLALQLPDGSWPVSYTHLTLPTICSV